MELLKQEQYQPMPVEEQVVVIYAGIKGYLDDLPIESVRKFEKEFLQFMRDKHQDILKDIVETKDLSKETEEKLIKAIEEFKDIFKKEIGVE